MDPNEINSFEKPSNQGNPPPAPNGMASVSLILGIIALVTSCCFYISIPAAGLSILFALLSKGYDAQMDARARTGIFLASIALVATLVMLITVITSGTFRDTVMEYYYNSLSFRLADLF